MYQYDSKGKAQSEKTKESAPATFKSHVQTGIKIPVQAKSLFSPSFSQENGGDSLKSDYSFRPIQLMPMSYSPLPLPKQPMLNQEQRGTKSLPIKSSEEQKRLVPNKLNNTGIPLQMKESVENLSGFSFDDVKIHYNSSKPAQLQALAYTQGNEVYVGSGQERHLEHELGHIVQLKQGRVPVTTYLDDFRINDDPVLEQEADRIGSRIGNCSPCMSSHSTKICQTQIIQLQSIAGIAGTTLHTRVTSQGAPNNILLTRKVQINQYRFLLIMHAGGHNQLRDAQRTRIQTRGTQPNLPAIAVLQQQALALANQYLPIADRLPNGSNDAAIINGLEQAMNIVNGMLDIPQQDLKVTEIQSYQNALHPNIYKVEIPVAGPADDKGHVLATMVSPVVADIGNDVSRILNGGQQWRNGGAGGLLNEFNVLYSCPAAGVHMEVEYNGNANSYARHAFIEDSGHPGQYREVISNNAMVGATSYSGSEDVLEQIPLTGHQRGVYQDQHGQNDYQGLSISGALDSGQNIAGDAASIAGVETARFAFLRPILHNLSNNTYLRFSGYAVTLGELLRNFHNVCIAHYQRRHQPVPAAGWEYYGLDAHDVHRWLTNKMPIILASDLDADDDIQVIMD